MVISGKIKKKKALIITEDRINALFEIIKKYGDRYKADNITKVESIIIIICSLIFGYFLVNFAKFVDNKILSNLFPSVVFCWGEEAKRFEKWSKLRTNIFWGIIVTALIGLVTSYLFKILTGE